MKVRGVEGLLRPSSLNTGPLQSTLTVGWGRGSTLVDQVQWFPPVCSWYWELAFASVLHSAPKQHCQLFVFSLIYFCLRLIPHISHNTFCQPTKNVADFSLRSPSKVRIKWKVSPFCSTSPSVWPLIEDNKALMFELWVTGDSIFTFPRHTFDNSNELSAWKACFSTTERQNSPRDKKCINSCFVKSCEFPVSRSYLWLQLPYCVESLT